MIKQLKSSLAYLAAVLFVSRLGFTIYVLYSSAIFLQKYIKINRFVLLFSLFLFPFVLFKTLFDDTVIVSIETFKYYFGFVVFLIILTSVKNINNSVVLIFMLICFAVMAEYFVINTEFIPQEFYPPSFISPDGSPIHGNVVGSRRAYGIALNHTMTATILSSLFIHIYKETNFVATHSAIYRAFFIASFATAILLIGSGLGYLLLIWCAFLLFANTASKKIFYLFIFLVIFSVVFYLIDLYVDHFSRFSVKYMLFLIDFKIDQLSLLLPKDYGVFEFLFGAANQNSSYNDIGWLPFFYAYGVLGVVLYAAVFLHFAHRGNAKSLFILFVGGFHYPALFSIIGQLLFAYLLTRKPLAKL